MQKNKNGCKTKKVKELLNKGEWMQAVDEFRKESKNTAHINEAMKLTMQVTNYRRSEIEGQPDFSMREHIQENLRATLAAIEADNGSLAGTTLSIDDDDD